ncbi:MAG: hypothetical protein A2V70_15475 [Planctomycetes bacterium RBG_13_63_9]|nr:MAG: hypothetical protein A2V70_15475 [Planctomycetes bacterium RBG_13_63_9]
MFEQSVLALEELRGRNEPDIVPHEPLPPVGTLGFRVNNYGLLKWGDLFSSRQLLALPYATKVHDMQFHGEKPKPTGEGSWPLHGIVYLDDLRGQADREQGEE